MAASAARRRYMSNVQARQLSPKPTPPAATPVIHPAAKFREGELYRLFRRRHGRTLPADDTGRHAAKRMLDAFALTGADARGRAHNFLTLWCPWLTGPEQTNMIEAAFRSPWLWSAQALGDDLGLTWDEREKCRITTIRPAGATDADMAERRKVKAAARVRENRRKATLHPIEKKSLPAIRAKIIADLLRPGERCTVRAICDQLRRSKHIRFAHLGQNSLKETAAFKAAVHGAIGYGVQYGLLTKQVEMGPRGLPLAWISKAGGSR